MPIPAAPEPASTTRVSARRRPEAAEGGQDAGDHDRRRPLDVVVERRHPVAVPIEDVERVLLLEVLPLDDAVGPDLGDADDERLEEVVILGPAQARRAMADVQRIGQELRVVCPDIERDRAG